MGLGNLGLAYDSLGDYAKAIEYDRQWLAIAREIKDRQSEGKALGNLGSAYLSLGDYAKAIQYAQQQLAISREIKDRQSEGGGLLEIWEMLTATSATEQKPSTTLSRSWRSPEKLKTAKARGKL